MARCASCRLTALEEPLDALDEEGTESEVECFFFALVAEDQNVAGLHERAGGRAINGSREVNRDGDLIVARGFAEDVEHAGRSASDALRRNAAQTAATSALAGGTA